MPLPSGTHRRQNGQGGIRPVRLATGELRYRARLRGKHLGMFEKEGDAEDAIERELNDQKGGTDAA